MREAEKRRHSKSSAPSGPADSDDSPKAAKRDGKPATERHMPTTHDTEAPSDPTDNGRARKRRLQDPLPLEEAPRRDGRSSFHPHHQHQLQQQPPSIVSENDAAAPVNPTYVPRSGYYFQHDDRTGPLSGRSNKRRDFERDGRREPPFKARYDERPRDDYRGRRIDRHFESSQAGVRPKAADDTWSHDKFLESQGEDLESRKQPVERARNSGRREFRETPPLRAENVDDSKSSEPEKRLEKRYPDNLNRRSEKGFPDTNLAQRERDRYREKERERGPDLERGRWMDSDSSRGRYNPRRSFNRSNGDGDQAGVRFDTARRNSGGNVVAVDRWSHDMFEELNRSPGLKQEEDSAAQIEALLAT